jgi:hypothetical protein
LLPQALIVVVVLVALLRITWLKGRLPLVGVTIIVGIAIGPSIFGRIALDYFQMLASPAMLSSLSRC